MGKMGLVGRILLELLLEDSLMRFNGIKFTTNIGNYKAVLSETEIKRINKKLDFLAPGNCFQPESACYPDAYCYEWTIELKDGGTFTIKGQSFCNPSTALLFTYLINSTLVNQVDSTG